MLSVLNYKNANMKNDYYLKQKRWPRCWRFCFVFTLIIMALLTAYTVNAQTGNILGIAPVQAPTNGTAIDGNAYANHVNGYIYIDPNTGVPQNFGETGDIFYWENVYPGPGGGVFEIIDRSGMGLPDTAVAVPYPGVDDYMLVRYFDDISNKDPSIFTSRNKINDHPATYTWGAGSNPNKNEIQNAGFIFTRGDASLTGIDGQPGDPDDLWCSWAADRQVTSGSSYIDFEFLQKPLYMDTLGIKNGYYYGGFTTEGLDGGRTEGDILVTVEFTNGGPVANVIVNRWTNMGGGTFMYQEIGKKPADPNGYDYGTILATVNTEKTYVHFPAFGKIEYVTLPGYEGYLPYYDINQWCEGAINLSNIFDLVENPCYAISTVFTRTRTSGESSTSELKDLPGPPAQVNIFSDPPIIECTDVVIPSCTDQATIASSYNDWKNAVGVSYYGGNGELTLLPGVFDPLPEDAECTGFSTTHDFIVMDECERTDTATCTFVVNGYVDDLVLSSCPGDPMLEGCSTTDEITTAWNSWKEALAAMYATATCPPEAIVFDPPLAELTMPAECVTSQQQVSVNVSVANMCDEATTTCTFTVEAYPDDLTLDECPGDSMLDGCSTTVEISAAWDAWIAGLQAMTEGGTCSDGTVVFDPPLGELTMPVQCLAEIQVISVTATAEDHCNSIDRTCTFTVEAYPDDLTLDECPGDPMLDGCSTTVEISAAWDAWIAGLQAMTEGGTCSDGTVVFDPPLGELTMPVQCLAEIQVVSVTATAEDHCNSIERTCTFTVEPYTSSVWASCTSGSVSEACLPDEQIDYEFQLWKDGFDYGGGCEPLITNIDELAALDWRNFGNMVDGYLVTFTLDVADHCTSASATCTFTIPPCAPECETAYGYLASSNKCFMNNDVHNFSNWGWTNMLTQPADGTSTYELPLYAGNSACDIVTDPVGMVTISYSSGGVMNVHYEVYNDYYLDQVHVYVGCDEFPMKKNGEWTVSPGQYTHGASGLNMATEYSVDFTNVSGDVWVIAHAVTCEIEGYTPDPDFVTGNNYEDAISCIAFKSITNLDSSTPVTLHLETMDLKVYPNPFDQEVTFEFVSNRDVHAILYIDNVAGERVATLLDGQIEKGVLNRIKYQPANNAYGMYFYRLILDDIVYTGKIIYHK